MENKPEKCYPNPKYYWYIEDVSEETRHVVMKEHPWLGVKVFETKNQDEAIRISKILEDAAVIREKNGDNFPEE